MSEAAVLDANQSINMCSSNWKPHYKKMQAYLGLDQPKEAIEAIQALLALNDVPSRVRDGVTATHGTQIKRVEVTSTKQTLADMNQSTDLLTKIKTIAADAIKNALLCYEKCLQIDPRDAMSLFQVGLIWQKALKFEKAIEWLQKGARLYPNQLDFAHELGVCHMGLGNYAKASEYFTKAKELAGDESVQRLMAVKLALYAAGQQQAGITILQEILKYDENHVEALFAYGKALIDHAGVEDSIPVFLKLLVQDTDNQELRDIVSQLVKKPTGLEKLKAHLSGITPSAQIFGFLAMVVKDYGGIDEAIVLYKDARALEPHTSTYVLNLVHVYEHKNEYESAFALIKEFCLENPDHHVGALTCATVYNLMRIWPTLTGPPNNDVPAIPDTKEYPTLPLDQMYDSLTLDLLAVFCTLTKIVYLAGNFQLLRPIIDAINPTREGLPLHTTTIRNEHAYHCCIHQLMAYHKPVDSQRPTLYWSGDSHALVSAWQPIEYRGVMHTIQPLLVTGLKCWHLRPESNFFPKYNFWHVAPTAPRGSSVVFQFGEIDCREGLVMAVQKLIYKDIEEGALVAINIYIDVLLQIKEQCNYTIYVHPAVPVIDITREIVKKFNKVLKKRVEETPQLIYLDIFSDLLTPDGTRLNPNYELDGTHMNPCFLPLVEKELKKHTQ